MGSIYLRGETLWIKYYRLGKPYRESANTKKETEAKRLLKLREGQVEEGKFPGLQVNRTRFNDLKMVFFWIIKLIIKNHLIGQSSASNTLKPFLETVRPPTLQQTG